MWQFQSPSILPSSVGHSPSDIYPLCKMVYEDICPQAIDKGGQLPLTEKPPNKQYPPPNQSALHGHLPPTPYPSSTHNLWFFLKTGFSCRGSGSLLKGGQVTSNSKKAWLRLNSLLPLGVIKLIRITGHNCL